jgi:hypothetical protein
VDTARAQTRCTLALIVAVVFAAGACKDNKGDVDPPKPGTAKTSAPKKGTPKKGEPTTPRVAEPKKKATSAQSKVTGKVPSKTFTLEAFHGVRVPAGGMAGPPPHGGRRMAVISYRIGKKELVSSLEALLQADGWKTTSRQLSPRGSLRLKVAKATKTLDVRVAGAGGRAAIIISK